jgi:hypothetical protein
MYDDSLQRGPRIARVLVLLTVVVNCGWAVTDAVTKVRAVAGDASHPLLRPYRSGKFGTGPLVTPTRGGVTAWLVLSRGAVVCALAGLAYFVLREEGAAAAGMYGAVVAVTALLLCLVQANPPPRPRWAASTAWIVARTVWLFVCAAVAWWYALRIGVRRLESSWSFATGEVRITERASFAVRPGSPRCR